MADETETPVTKTKVKAKLESAASAIGESIETATENATSTVETLKNTAGKLGKQAAETARDYASQGKARASGALNEVSRLMGDAASTVDDKLGAEYGKYARNAADTIASWSDQLKNKDLDDFVNDARELVRKNPAVAVGVAAALGFVVARLLRSSGDGDA
jgi:ElaB/YqjD/DUF883 family membrane-anchored ribosome-binding protein